VITTHRVSDLEGFQITNRIDSLQEMREAKKGKVDQSKLPKFPLGIGRRGLVKGWLGIRQGIQRRPTTKILGQETRNGHKGKNHDDSLDAIRESHRVETTNALKDQNQDHDDNDGIYGFWVESKDAIETTLDGNDLCRQINDGRQYLQKDDRISQNLRLEAIRDEIRWRLVISVA